MREYIWYNIKNALPYIGEINDKRIKTHADLNLIIFRDLSLIFSGLQISAGTQQ